MANEPGGGGARGPSAGKELPQHPLVEPQGTQRNRQRKPGRCGSERFWRIFVQDALNRKVPFRYSLISTPFD